MPYCYGCMKELNTNGKCPYCGFDLHNGTYVIQPHQLKPGTKLRDRYIIGKVIGEGGFGITYVGLDDFFGVKVAIKEFYMSGFVNRNNTYSAKVSAETGEKRILFEKNRERFYAEAKVLVKFSQIDGISKVRDFFYENDTAYIVMEYLQGRTLQSILKEKKTLSVDETIKIVKPILKALEVVHKENIIHRDISPDNIIITNDGKPWLIDFGAAREFAEDDMKSLSVILKHGYAPEEQYRRRGVQGPWTDIYALSATMYRCISGKRPDDALERLVEDETVELWLLKAECSKELSDVIMRGLSIHAKDRYQSATGMLADLNRVCEKPEPKPVQPEPKPVQPQPKPVQPEPRPVQPQPKPVQPHPRPVQPEPKPVQLQPRPVQPQLRPIQPQIRQPRITEKEGWQNQEETELLPYVSPELKYIEKSQSSKGFQQPEYDPEATEVLLENDTKKTKQKKIKPVWIILGSLVIIIAIAVPIAITRINTTNTTNTTNRQTVQFGSYEQDGNIGNGEEPIEWEVLATENGKSLLVTKYVLDCKRYNTKFEDVTWESCSLREWLNDDFLNTAFSADEQKSICSVSLSNPNNQYYGTNGGNSTNDKVFALSVDEIKKYYKFDYWSNETYSGSCNDLIIKPTTYAENQGVYVSNSYGGAGWWLRSPGYASGGACFVFLNGYVGAYCSFDVGHDNVGVRPALWVKN